MILQLLVGTEIVRINCGCMTGYEEEEEDDDELVCMVAKVMVVVVVGDGSDGKLLLESTSFSHTSSE